MRFNLVTTVSCLLALISGPALTAAYPQVAEPTEQQDPSTRPNIIFILADDLGYADLGVYGQSNFATPRLDRMAREGLRFTNAYSGSTVCAPSRACLLTGQHTGHVYQRGNGQIAFRRDPHDITIATRLRDAGYATAMIGKSGLASNSLDAALPGDKGFDYFFGLLAHTQAHRHYPPKAWRNGEVIEYQGNSGYEGDAYCDVAFVDDALQWIEQNDDGPFFLHLSLTTPHADLTVPEKYKEQFSGRFEETPYEFRGRGYAGCDEPRATYAAMVSMIDEQVGRVLDTLLTLQIDRNTLVFFASDNGPHYEGGSHPENHDSNGNLRGGKRDLYDGGIRTAQLAWWPGTIAPERVSDHITAFWDFAPTACELAGVDVPDMMDGLSLVPLLRGDTDAQKRHKYLYWEFYERNGRQAVRMNEYKGIRYNVHDDSDGSIQLYNIVDDPSESTDIAEHHPDVVRRVREIMLDAHEPSERFKFGSGRKKKPAQANRRLHNANDPRRIDKAGWRIVEASSESAFNGKVASNAIDGNTDSWWHSEWRDARPTPPHHLIIDLGKVQTVGGLRCLARQDAQTNGTVRDFTVSVSDRPDEFTRIGHEGTLKFTKDEQEVLFAMPLRGRYVKFEVNSSHAGEFACIAELELLSSKGL